MAHSDAQSVLMRVTNLLQDETAVRWTMNELVMWLNEAMTSTATLRPDSTARIVQVDLTGGERYVVDDLLPNGANKALRFMRLIRNVAPESNKGVIRSGSLTAMDSILPSWRSVGPSVNILNFLTNPEESVEFYVFPPAPVPDPLANPPIAPARVEMMYCAIPTPIESPGEGWTWADVSGPLSTETAFDTALVDYIMSRAFSKDSEYGGNGQRAASHFATYQQALGFEADGNMAAKSQKKGTS